MTPEAALALGALIGICFGYYSCWLHKTTTITDLEYDLRETEREVRILQDVNEGLAYRSFWQSEADRLRKQHAGTPYAGPGVRGGHYSASWLDDEEAA